MDLFCAAELAELCHRARELIWSEPIFLKLEAPICVMGDIHGQFDDLLAMLDMNGWPLSSQEFEALKDITVRSRETGKRPQSEPHSTQPESSNDVKPPVAAPKSVNKEVTTGYKRYLFLGDYVDRGPFSMEVVILLTALKLAYPDRIYLLRGNHESRSVNTSYGFYREVNYRYDAQLYECFQNMFNVFPFCAVINNTIMCMHGGISEHLTSFNQFSVFKRPLEIPDVGVLTDLTWADPDPTEKGYKPSARGASFVFGPPALRAFLKKLDLQMVIRGHQVVEDGYEFFDGRRLVTIFSAPNYCGQNDNTAAVFSIDKKLKISINVFRPESRDKKRGFEKERKAKK
ncbi:Serine/threonine-protein phosphatase [Caenorhabditis elegans]|uniref:Serine/threonine-protein phosphatase n=1 Tax=Caenorhabditis elegans TaxID=6239 RepID=Q27528_CAEEL|nr:Serine/threonine-protein phosphatase [Caenorhabditis elegans]CAA94374.2 Serine/threonine-protein phosphatase [Caenorhabditis elegans]|eukprot:NP_501992.2 Serine/threonine-protein phosphatase [Caenorhabditis elegans]